VRAGKDLNMRSSRSIRALVVAFALPVAQAAGQSPCYDHGSLGTAGDGTHSAAVTTGVVSLLGDPSDGSVEYQNPASGANGPARTTLAYAPQYNPPAAQPFSVEFWAQPWVDPSGGAGPCPLFNRQSAGNRTGWVWFQRPPGVGWNFVMYRASGSTIGVDLTGGDSQPFTLNHLVATWDGATARLYHNGALVASAAGPYVANASGTTLSVGGYDNGDNAYQGVVDDVAIYARELTAVEVATHFALGSSPVPNLYGATVMGDGALLYWRNRAAQPLGSRECAPPVFNSLGYPATLEATGSTAVSTNALTLNATLMPTGSFSFFLTSRTAGQIAQPGGSQGVLCLGGAIGRYVGPGQIQNSGAAGAITFAPNLTQTPTPNGLVAIVPGETWRFQAWYRDVVGGVPTSNFSDSLAITFQ
jgi:hypothetical protein